MVLIVILIVRAVGKCFFSIRVFSYRDTTILVIIISNLYIYYIRMLQLIILSLLHKRVKTCLISFPVLFRNNLFQFVFYIALRIETDYRKATLVTYNFSFFLWTTDASLEFQLICYCFIRTMQSIVLYVNNKVLTTCVSAFWIYQKQIMWFIEWLIDGLIDWLIDW